MSTTQEREAELYKMLEDLEEAQYQCNRDERQIEQMEEDVLWQNRNSTELINELFESYPQDKKLQRVLMEKEELLQRKISLEKVMFQELRENIHGARKDAEQQMDDYREELRRLREDTSNEDNNYDYVAPTCQKL